MEKQRKIKVLAVAALIITILGLTVAFAALSQNLTINGAATLDAAKWGIKFENLSNGEASADSTINDTAVIADDLVTINNIDVSLSTPGDSVTYTVDLVNEGTINAEIYSIETPSFTEEQERYISFKVTYDNGEEVKQGDILNSGTTKSLTIKIEFKKDLTEEDLPDTTQNISLSYKLNFVQTDEESTITTSKPINNYNIGDEICIDNECFYVIHDNGDSVTALAKYNLNIDDNKQSENNASTLAFSNTTYWNDEEGNLKTEYGNSYPADVYDSNSNLYPYVENYESYLKGLGKPSISARLITYNELINLGCAHISNWNSSCSSAPSWVYLTGYFSGSASENVWKIDNQGHFISSLLANSGIRPVIEISKEEI